MINKKRPSEVKESRRLPTVSECEACEYQKYCEGGRYCTVTTKSKKNKQNAKLCVNSVDF